MSIGSFGGVTGSAAGAPLSATQGSETERIQKDVTAQARQIEHEQHAQRTAGIGQTEEDQETSDRDADGRRLWERQRLPDAELDEGTRPRQSKDASGDAGNTLDLTG